MSENSARPFRRAAVGFAATVLVGAGLAASVGLAHAGDEPDRVGAPGGDGQDVTCTSHYPPPMNVPFCNVVGEDGDDGAAGTTR
ncbi:hypothetical protein [Pseudonocardia hierapolitana]|uniref:hypothetical protein n=1 Tax=Pseudonocardia hierapolitana TaxID=1128676 RepID=UPI0011BD47D6|nr:hypothetical protein [Pseudonocardia hierapolitana]